MILPPPVTRSDEEPIAAGGRQTKRNDLPLPATPSDEEPIAAGSRRL
jgi:hypothetical protein